MTIALSRAPGAERVVAPLEVYLDLVYAFVIGQFSQHLASYADQRTGRDAREARRRRMSSTTPTVAP